MGVDQVEIPGERPDDQRLEPEQLCGSCQVLTEIENAMQKSTPFGCGTFIRTYVKRFADPLHLHRRFRRQLALLGTENQHYACVCRNAREIHGLDVLEVR